MDITRLKITNYRGLREVDIPMSRFGCLIGENNSGKSSVLQSVALFFSGTKLGPSDYFATDQPVRIEIEFSGISDADLSRIEDAENRRRIAAIVDGGSLRLARIYDSTGKSSLKSIRSVPNEQRLRPAAIADLLKGKKPGPSLVRAVVEVFPELDGSILPTDDRSSVEARITALVDAVHLVDRSVDDADLPTGIDKSILPMLPQPIYIPAVKDLDDDVKTTESTSFGKLLSILFEQIEEQLGDISEVFHDLHRKLNVVTGEDGAESDGRLEEVQVVERTIDRFLKESFPNVSIRIRIPPPKLRSVLANAQIVAHDGVDGLLDSKGDGLKRSVTFAILRAYVEIARRPQPTESGQSATAAASGRPRDRYLLLFEEPELYLYPKAQIQLFDALRTFALDNHVMVTTHSPLFFGAEATETFVKLAKKSDTSIAAKPFTVAHYADMRDMTLKDKFQLVCHENNNAAFFSEAVVLVEGDSDFILFPHIAKTLNPEWDILKRPIAFARISGKGSIRRYRDFFSRFNMRVLAICDLDVIVQGFQHFELPTHIGAKREHLIRLIDARIDLIAPEPNAQRVNEASHSGELRSRWRRVREVRARFNDSVADYDELEDAIDKFFEWESNPARLEALAYSADREIVAAKRELLTALRSHGIFVLDKGAIEQYYPEAVLTASHDKPAKAQAFCRILKTREEIVALCSWVEPRGDEPPASEFDAIFATIFETD